MSEPTSTLSMLKRPIAPKTTKKCRYCGEVKPITEFYNSKNREQYGKKNMCKICSREKQRAWRKKNKGYGKLAKLKQIYGLSKKQYYDMFETQNGLCAICGKPETKSTKDGKLYNLSVDHDHVTGEVRALLCCNCNAALGHVNDDVDLLAKCIEYLEDFK